MVISPAHCTPSPGRHPIPPPRVPLFPDSVALSSRRAHPLAFAAPSMLPGNFEDLSNKKLASHEVTAHDSLLWRLFMLPISVCRIIWLFSCKAFSYDAERS